MASASGRLELPATSFMETFGFARAVPIPMGAALVFAVTRLRGEPDPLHLKTLFGSSRVSSSAPARQGAGVLAAIGKRHNTLVRCASAALATCPRRRPSFRLLRGEALGRGGAIDRRGRSHLGRRLAEEPGDLVHALRRKLGQR